MYKKSQITVFIILGIVILTIVGFVFYLSETSLKKKIEAPLEKTIKEFIKSKAINYYVTTCLDETSKKALILIGDQGGFIHKQQNGLIDWETPYIEYNGKNTTYQIYSSLSDKLKKKDILINNPFLYPCWTKGPNAGINCHINYNHLEKDYYFGSTKEPTNSINPDLCKKKETMPAYVCSCYNPPDSLQCKYSIQAQLEDYIQKTIKECTDFSNIKGYDITVQDVKANVTFSNDNVLFRIEFPIKIVVKDAQPVIKVMEFSLPQPVRLKTIHKLSRELIEKDIDDINFDIVKDGQKIADNYGNFEISSTYPYPNTSIISIKDAESKLDGKDYVFTFARENRAPALDYMTFISFEDYDYYLIENQTLNFTPTAFDPDESYLVYDYINWRDDKLTQSQIYISPRPYECIHPFSGEREARRCTTYKLNNLDVGEHVVTIRPKDPETLFDYQDINLLVDDIPKIEIETDNNYMYIPNLITSTEDLFIVDASRSSDQYPNPVKLLFSLFKKVDNNIETIYLETSNPILEIPRKKNDKEIENIKDKGFKLPLGVKKQTQTLILDLKNKANTPLDNTAVKKIDIEVWQCLPHRNANSPPYPFHTIEDPFKADHTCCKLDGSYESTSKTCYNLVDYGCLGDFTNPSSEHYDPGNLRTKGKQPLVSYNPSGRDDSADKYKRTLITKCSGNRGNTCDNVETYKIEFLGSSCLTNCKYSPTIIGIC